jgi:hypothetical protein
VKLLTLEKNNCMKRIIYITAIVLLFVSCTVTKQEKADNTSYQHTTDNAMQTVDNRETVQVAKRKESKGKTQKNAVSVTTQEQENMYYNPFRYSEEWKTQMKQAYAEVYQEFLAKECDTLLLYQLIENYNKTQDIQALYSMNGYCNCPEVIDYAIDLITTSLDEEARKIAIGMLGFRRHYDAIPLLLNHVKNNISSEEKIAIAATLNVLNRRTDAMDIFNCNCYDMEYMNNTCVDYYFYLSEDRLIGFKYFDYFLNKPQTRVEAASYLAKLGIEDKTFSVFEEFLKNNTVYQRETEISLLGLAAIGTEKSFELIKMMAQSENEMTAKRAQEIYNNYYVERRQK